MTSYILWDKGGNGIVFESEGLTMSISCGLVFGVDKNGNVQFCIPIAEFGSLIKFEN